MPAARTETLMTLSQKTGSTADVLPPAPGLLWIFALYLVRTQRNTSHYINDGPVERG